MKRSNSKLRFLYGIMLVVTMLVIVNIFFVVVMKYHVRSNTSLNDYVDSVSSVDEKIYASRGKILDATGQILAQDVQTYDIICYLDSSRLASGNQIAYVDNPSFAAKALAPILDMDANEIYDILTSNDGLYQVELGASGRNLSEEQKQEIESIDGLHGIGFRISYERYYPYGIDGSPQLVGFAKSDEYGKLEGKLGIESYLNEELSGQDGYHSYQQDKNGYVLPGMFEETKQAIQGYDVYLTIDMSIQEALNTALSETMLYKNASRAWGSVVEINTGKIVAWGQTPSYDPNNITSDSTQVNYGAQLAYEPGSVMKPVIYSAAIELGVYNGKALFNSAPYCYSDDTSRTYRSNALGCIYNVSNREWGDIELDYGLIYSSNVATATLLSEYVGINNYKDFMDAYHLYQKVNSDGIDEIAGYTNYGLSPVDDITATYGQGSSLTMLQLLQIYTAMFGDGTMLKPYLIDKIVDPNSNTIVYQGQRTVVSNPISEPTAKQLQDILRRVVSDAQGTCRHYAAKTVNVMGKTGTSEIPLDGTYSETDNIISCMLGFPYEDPQYMVYFAYISPETVYFNYDKKPIPDLVDRIALLEGLAVDELEASQGGQTVKYEMKNVLSKNVNEAKNIFNGYGLKTIVIGDGQTVIDQYPKENEVVYSNQKVFLLTDYDTITVPNFKNWTRKEIINYWNISNIPIVMDGFGVVVGQSVPQGSIYTPDSEIIVYLNDIEKVIETVTNEE